MPAQPTRRTRYALIGTGHRARMYVDAIAGEHAEAAELVAWSDVNPGRLDVHEARLREQHPTAAIPHRYAPDELERMIAEEAVDRVVVTSPDATHAGYVARALRAGADAVVEKPLTTDADGCRLITEAVEATGRNVVVTFNYRYSPRNSALREVIASGRIGRVTSVHFEWVLDTVHGADYFRRWHRQKGTSGGLLVHKSSHHFDLVNWWIDDVPRRVYASGGLRFYGAENAAARGLGPRPERGSTDEAAGDPFALDMRRDPTLKALYYDNESHDGYRRDRDVFSEGITIEDNMAVVVDYHGGPTLTYSLNAHSPWEGYTVAVNGTEGRAELTVVERGACLVDGAGVVVDPSANPHLVGEHDTRPTGERLLVQRHWETAQEVAIVNGTGGHGGGDALLLHDLFRGPGEDPLGRPAGYLDGLRSVAVGIAANTSLEQERPVLVADLGLGADLRAGRGDLQPRR
ncbi:Gfo/Idh/MocA family oxidoreductase [Kineococcus glutinatus]|uniref:Gfo/Idh/MocA family oxidoreductase n=1 Tax=Kineococcus glutinatus TaxID=1070872 RepID=A0ABP9I1G5_9ACTN